MLEFKPLHLSETEALVSLWEACGLTKPWNDPHSDIKRMAGKQQSDILVAHQNDKLIASVMVGHEGRRAWVYYLAVTPEHRGQGYGKEALKQAENWAKSRGLPKIQLMVRADNSGSIPFYQSAGFKQLDIIYFEKWLDEDMAARRIY